MELTIKTEEKRQIVDITRQIEKVANGDGNVHIFVCHTTAAITTADLDPGGTDKDYLEALFAMTPNNNWNHPHDPGHFPDHLWASIIGPDLSVPLKNGALVLGTWQRIVLVELDGPRERKIYVGEP